MPDPVTGKWTMAEYVELKGIIGSGVYEAEFDGPDGNRRVKYMGYESLIKLKMLMERDLGICTKPRGRIRMSSDKGYHT